MPWGRCQGLERSRCLSEDSRSGGTIAHLTSAASFRKDEEIKTQGQTRTPNWLIPTFSSMVPNSDYTLESPGNS